MRSCLINPMGTSPMVATEMVDFLREYDKNLTDIIMISTKSERVINGSYMAGSAIKNKFKNIRVHYEFLDMEDIKEDKDIVNFLDVVGSIIKKEKENYQIDKVYANISGGRKVESVILSNFSQLIGIDETWIVINLDISNYNVDFERILNELKNFTQGENLEYYEKNRDKFDPIFFPPRGKLSFFEIPTVKLSRDDLRILQMLLKGGLVEGIPDYKIEAFVKSKLLVRNPTRGIPTEIGEIILKYISV